MSCTFSSSSLLYPLSMERKLPIGNSELFNNGLSGSTIESPFFTLSSQFTTISVMVTGSIPFIKRCCSCILCFPSSIPLFIISFTAPGLLSSLHCSYFYVRQKCMLLVCKEELMFFFSLIVIISLIIKCLRI